MATVTSPMALSLFSLSFSPSLLLFSSSHSSLWRRQQQVQLHCFRFGQRQFGMILCFWFLCVSLLCFVWFRHLVVCGQLQGEMLVEVVKSFASRLQSDTVESARLRLYTYLAVQTSDPVTRDRATYATLVVREAMWHEGQDWFEYDCLFRQQAALNWGPAWNVIHPELQETTIFGQQSTTFGNFCSLCQECDHSAQQCALAQLQQPAVRNIPTQSRQHGRNLGRICSSKNNGTCIYPGMCSYRHICSNCF